MNESKLAAIGLGLGVGLLWLTVLPATAAWVEQDRDRPGGNFHTFPMTRIADGWEDRGRFAKDPGWCREACELDAVCKAYSYESFGTRGNTHRSQCALKDRVPEPVAHEGMISGVKRFTEQSRTFSPPLYRTVQLNICLRRDEECGRPVADRWCQAQGFSSASGWKEESNVDRNLFLGDEGICSDADCSGFSEITCTQVATMTPQAPTGPAGPGALLPPQAVPEIPGVQADAITGFRQVVAAGDSLTFEVDYSVEATHGNPVYLGGWIFDRSGSAVSGYKPTAIQAPGRGRARLEISLDSGASGAREIEFFLSELAEESPFVRRRFPLDMRLPGGQEAVAPKLQPAPGYQVGNPPIPSDISGSWRNNLGHVYHIHQVGGQIGYDDPILQEHVMGSFTGKTVTVNWSAGSVKGTITKWDDEGRAERIEWENGVVFER
jgi:hypothetical protein